MRICDTPNAHISNPIQIWMFLTELKIDYLIIVRPALGGMTTWVYHARQSSQVRCLLVITT